MLRTDPAYVRRRVYGRDRGVCARCGRDTAALKGEVLELWTTASDRTNETSEETEAARARLAELGLEYQAWRWAAPHLWEAHHVVAVSEGGGGCGLDGYQTLCIWCHRRETGDLAQRRAERRRLDRERTLGIQRLPLDL